MRFINRLAFGLLLSCCGATALAANCPSPPDGLKPADGLCVQVFAHGVGAARHLAISADGTVYVMTDGPARSGAAPFPALQGKGPIVALRDTDGDGRANAGFRFGKEGGTGLALAGTILFAGEDRQVRRYLLDPASGRPLGEPSVVVAGFPNQRQHAAKSIALDAKGGLYVNVGAPSNACQRVDRQAGSPGQEPCPERERQAGIWRYAADRTGQRHPYDGRLEARGIRNAVALAWRRAEERLYAVQHGRDQLSALWPDLYDSRANAEQPAEEVLRIRPGSDFGWPYCYFDTHLGRRVLAPEYGGDGRREGRCHAFAAPVAHFPAHMAPNALVFDDAGRLPPPYQGGAFIAMHGSWNRAPLPQAGYSVEFLPFSTDGPSGAARTLVGGFAGDKEIHQPSAARYRPSGLAIGPDGSLYVSDSQQGRIWRIVASHPSIRTTVPPPSRPAAGD